MHRVSASVRVLLCIPHASRREDQTTLLDVCVSEGSYRQERQTARVRCRARSIGHAAGRTNTLYKTQLHHGVAWRHAAPKAFFSA